MERARLQAKMRALEAVKARLQRVSEEEAACAREVVPEASR